MKIITRKFQAPTFFEGLTLEIISRQPAHHIVTENNIRYGLVISADPKEITESDFVLLDGVQVKISARANWREYVPV